MKNQQAARRRARLIRISALAGGAFALTFASAAMAQTMMSPQGFGAPGAPGVGASPPVSMPPEAAAPPVAVPPELTQPQQASPMSECEAEMVKHQKRRQAQMEAINNMVKSNKGKGLDPVAACPKFKQLVAIESQMRAWVLKNKEWCSIPDQLVENMNTGFAKTPVFAQRACAAAAQARRAQQGGGLGGPAPAQPAVKLPSGPL